MKKFIAIAACTLPLALGGPAYAQGTKGPSGSGAENASKQSRSAESNAAHSAVHGNSAATRGSGTQNGETRTKSETDTPRAGGPDSNTSVAPVQPTTPRMTEPGAGRNRSASGDSAGTDPRSQEDEGFR